MAFYRSINRSGSKTLLLVFAAASLLACSPVHRGPANRSNLSSGGGSNSALSQSASVFEQTLYPILQTNCASCHGAGQDPEFAVTDIQTGNDRLTGFGLVNFTDAATSDIVVKIQGGHNAIPVTVAEDIRLNIEAWALGANLGGPTADVALAANYESINNRIFINNCNNCHSGNNPAGGLDLSQFQTAVAGGVNGGFNLATPALTPLYVRITDPNAVGGLMPPGGQQLSQEEADVILMWITLGGPLN